MGIGFAEGDEDGDGTVAVAEVGGVVGLGIKGVGVEKVGETVVAGFGLDPGWLLIKLERSATTKTATRTAPRSKAFA